MSDDRIKKLEMQLFSEKALRQSLEETASIHSQRQNARIEQLEAALDDMSQYVSRADWHYLKDETRIALEGKKDE